MEKIKTVQKERSNWRDQEISKRHRKWGWDCPAIDIDFLMLEFDEGEPIAIVEYKNENAAPAYPTHPSYKAIRGMCDKAELPFFGVRYAFDFSWWKVKPINSEAQKVLKNTKTMSEKEYVQLLYDIRGKKYPQELDFF